MNIYISHERESKFREYCKAQGKPIAQVFADIIDNLPSGGKYVFDKNSVVPDDLTQGRPYIAHTNPPLTEIVATGGTGGIPIGDKSLRIIPTKNMKECPVCKEWVRVELANEHYVKNHQE